MSLCGDNIGWTALSIEDNLTKENFLLDDGARGDLKLFCPNRLPTALAEESLWDAQVAVEARIDDGGKRAGSHAKDQLDRNDRLSVPIYSTSEHTQSRSLCTAG